jgi:hypothetical protein
MTLVEIEGQPQIWSRISWLHHRYVRDGCLIVGTFYHRGMVRGSSSSRFFLAILEPRDDGGYGCNHQPKDRKLLDTHLRNSNIYPIADCEE